MKLSSILPNGPDCWTAQPVLFCNHEGTFVADVIVTPESVTVLSSEPVTPDKLNRKTNDQAAWRISDAHGGYWSPMRGRFVLPRKAVTRL